MTPSLAGLVLAVALRAPLPVPYVAQPPGPFCTAAATAMLAGAHGRPADALALAREVPVHVDGIAWVDLADLMRPRGLELLVVQLDPAHLDATLTAGQPVIAAVRDGAQKHVWVLAGQDALGYDVLDPAHPGRRRATRAELAARWAAGQAVIVVGPRSPGGLPLAEWRRQHARFAALEWGLRAEAAGGRDASALALYDRAVALDAGIAALHNNRGVALAALGRKDEARAAFREALRLDPGFGPARDNLAALGR